MSHPLANDSTLPSVLQRAFARVGWQTVKRWDDGRETIANFMTRESADKFAAKYAPYTKALGGKRFANGCYLVSVEIRTV